MHDRVPLPPAVWLIVGLHGLLLVLASVLYPTYRAPDEAAHVDMVLALRGTPGYPVLGEQELSRRVTESLPLVGHDPVDPGAAPRLDVASAPPRDARPSFDEVAPDEASGRLQQMAAHPPLYYALGAGALGFVPDAWSFDQVVGFLRLFSALLVLPLPLLAAMVAARLSGDPDVVVAAALVPVAVPQLTHIGSAVNNDNLLILLVAGLTLPLVAAARGDLSLRTGLAAGLLSGLALLTKGFGLALPGWILIAYGVAARRAGWRSALPPAVIALGSAAVLGGWWWVRNLVDHGRIQPGVPTPAAPEGFAPDAAWWLPFYVNRMVTRFWLEPNIVPAWAPPVEWFATFGLVALLVVGVVAARRAGLDRLDALVLLAPTLLLAGMVTVGAWRVYARTSITAAIHGRYLYPGLAGLALVVAAGAVALGGRRRAAGPAVLLGAVVLLQVLASALALRQYWSSPGAVLAWSPWPAGVVLIAVLGAVVVAALLALRLVREART